MPPMIDPMPVDPVHAPGVKVSSGSVAPSGRLPDGSAAGPRQDAVKKRRAASGERQGAAPAPRQLLASPPVRTTTGRPPGSDRRCAAVADVVFVVLTLVVFGLLALAVRGVEKL